MTVVRFAWHEGRAVALGRPDPADLDALRRHREALTPIVAAYGDCEIELRSKPGPDWDRIRMLMRCGRPARKRVPTRRRSRA